MQIEVKEREPYILEVSYASGVQEVLDKKGEVLNAFKLAPIPGFRKGKAPLDVINRHYKKQVDDSLKKALLEDAFHNTLFEKKIRAHGAPKFNKADLIGNSFTCEFEMHSKPDFSLVNLEELEVVKPHFSESIPEITEKMLQEMRVRKGNNEPFSEKDRAALGDNVMLDYQGSCDGQTIDTLCAEGELLTLGRSAVKEFDESIVGMALGETKDFDIIVGDNSFPSVSGKKVHFTVTLTMGSKNIPAGLDDSLANSFGKANLAELRTAVAASATVQCANKQKELLHNAINNKLIASHSIDVPTWMSSSEAQYLAQQSKVNWEVLPKEDKEKLLKLASDNCKLALILEKVREDEPLANLSDQEVFEIVKANISKSNAKDADEAIKKMQANGYLQILFSRIRDEHAMDFIAEKLKVIE